MTTTPNLIPLEVLGQQREWFDKLTCPLCEQGIPLCEGEHVIHDPYDTGPEHTSPSLSEPCMSQAGAIIARLSTFAVAAPSTAEADALIEKCAAEADLTNRTKESLYIRARILALKGTAALGVSAGEADIPPACSCPRCVELLKRFNEATRPPSEPQVPGTRPGT